MSNDTRSIETADPSSFEAPERRYDDDQLARMLEISSEVECECPNHLAILVSRLVSFEEYSKTCANKSEEDAKVHAYLYRQTARAREIMEEALEELARFEGIEV